MTTIPLHKISRKKSQFGKKQQRTGISKTIPIIRLIIINVSIYEDKVIVFSTSILT